MTLLIYFIFRLLLLVAIAIGSGQSNSQSAPASNTKVQETPLQSRQEVQQLLQVTLDSTLKAVEELKEIPKTSDKIIQKNNKLIKKLDRIYYGSILPLKYLTPKQPTVNKIYFPELRHIEPLPPALQTECVSLPEIVTPEIERPGFFNRIFHKK